MTTALEEAIHEFIEQATEQQWHTAAGAENRCNIASDAFLHVLEEYGIEGEIEHYEREILLDRKEYPYGALGDSSYHWAVRVGDTIIDWTARQFDEQAPFPAVWKAARREWRNCTEVGAESPNSEITYGDMDLLSTISR